MMEPTPVGKTKGQGWEIGVRRTLPITSEKAWQLLVTQPGMGYWLGHGVKLDYKKGETYQTDEETTGEIRSYNQGSLIRMLWQPKDWNEPSTLQIRVLPAKTGATISIHHEKLESGEQREKMRAHWMSVMDQLEALSKKDS